MKTFNFWSRLFMLLISSLKLDTNTVHSMIEELLTEHKHISSITPIPISSFLVFLHVGKALQSAEVQDKALRQGNNHFFTFINTMDFGKVDLIRSGNCPSMIGKLTEFIQD
jgi:hypothetical protein